MENSNPYIAEVDNFTDEELFDIIDHPDDHEVLKYQAAISIALKRELISEYQATGLLAGDITVMDYNPNNLEEQNVPYEKKEPVKERIPVDVKFKRYGVYMVGLGILALFLTYQVSDWHSRFFSYIDFTLAAICIVGGLVSLVVGAILKIRKKPD